MRPRCCCRHSRLVPASTLRRCPSQVRRISPAHFFISGRGHGCRSQTGSAGDCSDASPSSTTRWRNHTLTPLLCVRDALALRAFRADARVVTVPSPAGVDPRALVAMTVGRFPLICPIFRTRAATALTMNVRCTVSIEPLFRKSLEPVLEPSLEPVVSASSRRLPVAACLVAASLALPSQFLRRPAFFYFCFAILAVLFRANMARVRRVEPPPLDARRSFIFVTRFRSCGLYSPSCPRGDMPARPGRVALRPAAYPPGSHCNPARWCEAEFAARCSL